jgi:hypothetical protein
MKRFVGHSFLFLTLLFGVPAIYIRLFPMWFEGGEYAAWKYTMDFADGKIPEPDPEILVLGDSRAIAGILPERLAARARTLGLGAGTSLELYYLLRKYLSHHSPPKLVLLSISPHHFRYQSHAAFWERSVKWGLLSLSELGEVEHLLKETVSGDLTARDSIVKGLPYGEVIDALLYRSGFLPYYQADVLDGGFFRFGRENRETYARLIEERGHFFYDTLPDEKLNFEAKLSKELEVDVLYARYLQSILELGRGKGIPICFVTMPFSEASYRAVQASYRQDFTMFLTSMLSRFPGARGMPDIVSLPDRYFSDGSHLNPAGAELFTGTLAETIRLELGIETGLPRDTAAERR